MPTWMSDDEMAGEEKLLAGMCMVLLATGGASYYGKKDKLYYWSAMRRKCSYLGGFVENTNPTPEQARRWLAENE